MEVVCRRCKIVKPDAEVQPLQPRYATRVCWQCFKADAKRNRQTNETGKVKARAGNLKRRYGISLDDYKQMLEAQAGVCRLCGQPPCINERWVLNVDHCHKTGRVRGLLCALCNTALGKFNDDPVILRRAADYLEDK